MMVKMKTILGMEILLSKCSTASTICTIIVVSLTLLEKWVCFMFSN